MTKQLRKLLAFSLAVTLHAAEPHWLTLRQVENAAIQAHDYAKLRQVLVELKPLMPGNPRNTYNLAASETMLGNRAAALACLKSLADMGLVFDIAADQDFASLRDSPAFTQILKRMEQNRSPVSHASFAFALPAPDLLPEDIAYDAKTRRFFTSSVRNSRVVLADGKEFAPLPWSGMALAADSKRRLLWASAAWVPHCSDCPATDKDRTALFAFDLDSGALKQRIESPVPGLLGDMTAGRRGDIYVSEGIHGAVFHLAPGGAKFERLDEPGEFPSPQTPALSADEKRLYVPDYVRGIAAIDLATRKVTWLQPADNISLAGIDGLYVHGDSFIAIQNGTKPARIVRFSLDLQRQQILEANTKGLGETTHGTFVGDTFYFIANSGWSEYDGAGKKKAGPAVMSEIRKLTIPRNRQPVTKELP